LTVISRTVKGGWGMRRITLAFFVIAMSLCLAGNVFAESATKDECVAKTKESAAMVNEKGLDAAVAEINKKDGKFVWKDSYVFLMDFDGKMLGHPMSPALIGQNVLDRKDKAEKFLFKEFVAVAKSKGDGWVDYMWANPGDPAPRKKISYIHRVPGKDLLVGAGIWE